MLNLNDGMFGGNGILYLGRGRGLQFVRPMNLLRPPQNVTAIVSGSDIDITWTAANNVDGYNIYQSINGGAWTKLNATATTDLTYTLTPTEPGEYNFRVTSVRGDKESAPSAETLCDGMMEQVYSDTITGLRISAVDGTAFVDGADESVYESDFSRGLDGWGMVDTGGGVSTWTHNVDEGVLAVTGAGTKTNFPMINKGYIFDGDHKYYTVSFDYTVNSGTCILNGFFFAGNTTTPAINETLSGTGTYSYTTESGADPAQRLVLYFNGTKTFNLSIHSITVTKHPAMSISADYADGNHLLEIEDSLGNVASGVLSAQGSGEVLGSELVTNGDFETGDLTGWSVTGDLTPGASINVSSPLAGSYDVKIENTDDTKRGGISAPISVSIGGLYKTLLNVNLISGDAYCRVVQSPGITGSGAGWAGNLLNTAVAGSYNITQYSTEAAVTTRYIVLGTYLKEVLQYLDNVSAKQVTAPSTSGAFIVSEIYGATRDFVSIPAGFTYNQSSYICRVKKILPTA